MTNIKLSILIPTIPDRTRRFLEPLFSRLMAQVGNQKDVEIIALMDNKTMSIGRKKTLLFNMARGKYSCLIDDDDDVSDDFISTLRDTITSDLDVDVICYNQEADINGKKWIVKTNLNYKRSLPLEQLTTDSNGVPVPCHRPPWQWCTWKTSMVNTIPFADTNWAEDATFTFAAIERAKTQLVLDKIMCKYRWSPNVSQAPLQDISPMDAPLVSL